MHILPHLRNGSLLLLASIMLMSCGKGAFVNEMQGKWQVTEINYVSDNGTTSDYPTNMFFLFQGNTYQTLIDNVVAEAGNFDVNYKVTQISFYSLLGNSTMLIEEKSPTAQYWRSKNKIVDFYLYFKLSKIE